MTEQPTLDRPTPDTDAAVDFLTGFWKPGGPWALTAIDPDKKQIETHSWAKGAEDEMRAWISKFNGTRNLYFTVNPIRREISKKASRGDIKELAWLHVDVDPEPKEDFGKERERILALLQAPPALPKPTLIIDSGGGFQAFWKLKEPFPIDGEEDKYEEAKRWNQQLEIIFNADNCHNVDRIMRLPGSINLPDAKKKAKGRKIALAGVAEVHPELVYELSKFTPAPKLQEVGGHYSFGPALRHDIGGNIARLASVDELPETVKDSVKIIIVQGHERWLRKFGRSYKWIFCLTAAKIVAANQELR